MFRSGTLARHVPALGLWLSLVLALLTSAAGVPWLTIAAVALSILLEIWVGSRGAAGAVLLEQAGLAVIARFLLRALSVALVLPGTPALVAAFAAAVLLLTAGQCFAAFGRAQLAKAYATPVLVRNIDLPHRPARSRSTSAVVIGAVGEAAVLLATLLAAPAWLVLLLGLLAAGALLLLTLPVARGVLHNRHGRVAPGELAPKLRSLQAHISSTSRRVLVHLAGGAADAYQINVWLDTLERLDEHVLVLLRDPGLFAAMAPTTLPVACVVSGTDVMSLDLSPATVALFPANVGSNLHVFRLPTLMSAFIGHGDSDKSASVNPFAKVYDELWVAGEAGARRWRRAEVGVREDQLVLVGRPQIADVRTRTPRAPGSRSTLLYAPTWEAWNSSQDYCSVRVLGVRLIEAALTHPVGLRVIYKPHPMLGRRDPKVLSAHRQIVRLLSQPAGRHEVVAAGGRSLFDCFNDSDALATDISSVVSDYLASEKPYAVFNVEGVRGGEVAADEASVADQRGPHCAVPIPVGPLIRPAPGGTPR